MVLSMKELLRQLPSVDEILKENRTSQWLETYPRVLVLEAIRTAIDRRRKAIIQAAGIGAARQTLPLAEFLDQTETLLRELSEPSLQPVINATGVIVHTNLGRSILSDRAIQRVVEVSRSYSNLEYDISAGERGKRYVHVEGILTRLTGVEAATAVNNNAAAVLLCLNTLARGKEVIVSRGELVEIGGSFRVPDVMERSGATLREVGTTNKTHLKDYEKAINENTGLILKVHTSNYKIVGFTKEVSAEELAKLGKKHDLPVMWDLGSGSFIDLSTYGAGERAHRAAGRGFRRGRAHLQRRQTSGRTAGGHDPRQKGLSRSDQVQSPCPRAPDRQAHPCGARSHAPPVPGHGKGRTKDIPTLWMLTQPLSEIERKAGLLADGPQGSVARERIVDNHPGRHVPERRRRTAHGNLPDQDRLPPASTVSANQIESRLRLGKPHIITRIKEGMVILDPRTLNDEEIGKIVEAVRKILTSNRSHRAQVAQPRKIQTFY